MAPILINLVGIVAILLIAFLLSTGKKRISPRVVGATFALQALMAAFPFAACVPFSGADGSRGGLLFRAAAHEAPDDALLSRIEGLLGLQAPDTLRYADRRRGQHRQHDGQPKFPLAQAHSSLKPRPRAARIINGSTGPSWVAPTCAGADAHRRRGSDGGLGLSDV